MYYWQDRIKNEDLVKFESTKSSFLNALSRAYIISTMIFIWGRSFFAKSVNALSRAHIISTALSDNSQISGKGVSMPLVGLTSFLRRTTGITLLCALCVNALSRAHIISTRKET